MAKKIKVMVVDDSALVRKVMAGILTSDPDIEVVAQVQDPIFALKKLEKITPDVITLDIEMPRMDGITFLKKLMSENPLPVVICSSLAKENADTTMQAMRAGAVEIITKSELGVKNFFEDAAVQIIDAVKAAAQAKVKKRKAASALDVAPKLTADAILSQLQKSSHAMSETTDKLIAVGASTGGTQALREVLSQMPSLAPGMVIVQHMPEKFTTSFAQSLNDMSAMEVREAKNGDRLQNGLALIAPGGKHMLLKRNGAQYHIDIVEGPLVSRHRPSVDVLFRSVARYAGPNVVAALLTGMGDDGAAGLKEISEAGGRTFAQDEATSVVFGMPQEAWKLGAAEALIPLPDVAKTLVDACQGKRPNMPRAKRA